MFSNEEKPVYYNCLMQDTTLAKLLHTVTPYQMQLRPNICLRLCASIMSQQLSTRVADVIFQRFLALYGGAEPTAKQIRDTPFEQLRGVGLSNAKANYVRNVAEYMIEHGVTDEMLLSMSNDEIIAFLTPIKGVGRWTVEMLLMFTLGREDVFAIDDLGIQQAMAHLYGVDLADKKQSRAQMLQLSAKWMPYRTYACFFLWKYKDAGLPPTVVK